MIVVLLLLVIVSILGVGGAQIAAMAERGSRNDRDMQVAWQAAEAALMDAEYDVHGPNTASASRQAIFTGMKSTNDFVLNCGATGKSKGLCALVETGKPAWLTVDFTTANSSSPKSTEFGEFTGRSFAAGTTGIQPVRKPRYVVEPIRDPANRDRSSISYIYRVTSMGFGPRADIQAVAQTIYRD
ncbi:MAG: PilX N-terminal domain-containing pilus assembly protein [Variovorax sp.]